MKIKKCGRCQNKKDIIDFPKNRSRSDGYHCYCKQCNNDLTILWTNNNPGKVKQRQQRHYAKHKEHYKLYREKHKVRRRLLISEWAKNNPTNLKNRKLKFYSQSRNKLSKNFSWLVWYSIKENKNNISWKNLVPYTLEALKNHLEKLFKSGMSWANYGKDGWHIDHIIPISLWKFNSYEDREFKQCWALANLQPLWAQENCIKNNRILE